MLDLMLLYLAGSLALLVIYVCAVMIYDAVKRSHARSLREREFRELHVLRRASITAFEAREAAQHR